MELRKINVKFYVADPGVVSLDPFVGIFNAWIQASDGEYYDLADYNHVPAGPGVLLIAHEANISIDNTGNRLGLLYNRKQDFPGPNQEKLRAVFGRALDYCRRIEDEPVLGGGLRFRGDEALVIINDRLSAPNTEETFAAVKPEIEAFGRILYGGASFSLEREPDPKKRFAVQIKSSSSFDIRGLIGNVSRSVN